MLSPQSKNKDRTDGRHHGSYTVTRQEKSETVFTSIKNFLFESTGKSKKYSLYTLGRALELISDSRNDSQPKLSAGGDDSNEENRLQEKKSREQKIQQELSKINAIQGKQAKASDAENSTKFELLEMGLKFSDADRNRFKQSSENYFRKLHKKKRPNSLASFFQKGT